MYYVPQVLRPNSNHDTTNHHGALDLLVLRYMARRVHLNIHRFNQSHTTEPLYMTLPERRNRFHRLIIYKHEELLLSEQCTFVGFVSRQQAQAEPSVVQAVYETDTLLVKEMAANPGILSYSSLELKKNVWYNLVLFGRSDYRHALKNSSTHTLAAYTLAPHYYAWIRLHKGYMPEGLDHHNMTLQHTTCYTF